MKTFTTINTLREEVLTQKSQGKQIGFVPTMGNLHAGHISLVSTAKQHCDFVIASIFVNPLQFGQGEDLDNYPRTLDDDQHKLINVHCDALFIPNIEDMYPQGMHAQTTVSVPTLTSRLCGASRPGHFDGVTTVVSKLFNMVQADSAFFGEKDFQQLAVIRKMSQDMNIPTDIIGVPIVRDSDNLALSSRNGYLSQSERALAPQIYTVLQACKSAILEGERDFNALTNKSIKSLENNGLKVDYFEICQANTLELAQQKDVNLVILAAASLGNTRLIDNITLLLN